MIKVSKEIILSILKDRMAGIISLCLLIGLFCNVKAQYSEEYFVSDVKTIIADLNNDVFLLTTKKDEKHSLSH